MEILNNLGSDIVVFQSKKFCDNRGQFTKIIDSSILSEIGFKILQINYVTNINRNTCRGLHYQLGAFAESKIFRVLTGKAIIYAVNIRRDHSFFGQVFTVPLDSPENAVWFPRGYATGYLTLCNNTTVMYLSDNDYCVDAEEGIRINDPALDISLPCPFSDLVLSEKDRSWPLFKL